MAKGTKRDEIVRVIVQETEPFHPSKIAGITKASVPYVQNIINTLEATGRVTTEKRGKKVFYTVVRDEDGQHELDEYEIESCKAPKKKSPAAEFSVAERFDFVRRVTQLVIEGCNPSGFLTGSPGIGKTHIVREQLRHNGLVEGQDYDFIKGHVSSFGLFSLLYHKRDNGLLIFDDCDQVFKNDLSANILKAALDSYDVRRVTWYSRSIPEDAEDIERDFIFDGNVMFITNVPVEQIDPAIKSRTLCIDLELSRREITDHMRNVLRFVLPKETMELKIEVLDYLGEIENVFGEYNLRTLMKGIRIRKRYEDPIIWKGLIRATAHEE